MTRFGLGGEPMKRSLCLVALVALFWCPACGSEDKDILIGGVTPKTGSAAAYGKATEDGIRLAAEQANAAGGLLGGRKIKMLFEDDKGDPGEGRLAFSRLIERERVCAVIGAVMSNVSRAGADVAESNKVPMISPASTNPLLTLNKKYVFRACFTDAFQGRVVAKFAKENLGKNSAAVLYDSSNDYNKGLADVFRQVFTKLGGKVVAYESYSAGTKDFSPQLTKILETRPDVLFLPNYYNDVDLQARKARAIGIKATLLGGDGWTSTDLLKLAEMDGGYFTNHFSPDSGEPQVKKFMTQYKERFKTEPDALSSLGYDAARILFDAIERAGSDDPGKIRDALEKADTQCLAGPFRFDANHNTLKPIAIIRIEKKRHVFQAWIKP